jgi:hypothetical protein
MAKLTLPQRGQPLDVAYIYQIVEAVNNLSNQLNPTTAKYTTIDTAANGQQSVRTADARIVGGYKAVTRGSATNANSEVPFNYTFSDFKYVPIVTATPIIISTTSTDASKDVSVVLTQVTTNRVDGIVKFNTSGVSSVGVNLVIVGIPIPK